jgi:hypothetical protein
MSGRSSLAGPENSAKRLESGYEAGDAGDRGDQSQGEGRRRQADVRSLGGGRRHPGLRVDVDKAQTLKPRQFRHAAGHDIFWRNLVEMLWLLGSGPIKGIHSGVVFCFTGGGRRPP